MEQPAIWHVQLASLDVEGPNRESGDLSALAASILAVGVLQPVVVKSGDVAGRYAVVAGRRRVLAARSLDFETVPAVLNDQSANPMLLRLVENVARVPLAPSELATHAAALAEKHRAEDVAKALGYSPSYVRNLVRLAKAIAPDVWVVFVAEGRSASIERWIALASLSHDEQRERVLVRKSAPPAPPDDAIRRRARDIRRKLATLPEHDTRARVLRWVLGEGEWPEEPDSLLASYVDRSGYHISANRSAEFSSRRRPACLTGRPSNCAYNNGAFARWQGPHKRFALPT